MATNNDKVYVVTHCHTSNNNHRGQSSSFDVLGVCKDLEEAKRIAREKINEYLSAYGSSEHFEITYKPSEDEINWGIEALDETVYMHMTSFITGNTIVRSVQVHESEIT